MSQLRALMTRVQKLLALIRQPQYRRALRHGVAASVEHDQTMLSHDYRTILDVGANRGQFALVAARRFPDAALFCFEPLEQARAALRRALGAHANLRIIEVAAAAIAGESVFHVTRADDSSSLLPSTSLQVETFPGTQVVEEMVVATDRLDAVIATRDLVSPVLMKIDVQGTELEVLQGASGLLERVDTILVECSFVELYAGQSLAHDVITHVFGWGFRLASVVAPTTDGAGRVLQADLVFERLAP